MDDSMEWKWRDKSLAMGEFWKININELWNKFSYLLTVFNIEIRNVSIFVSLCELCDLRKYSINIIN